MTNYRSDRASDLNILVNKISIASKNYEIKRLIANDIEDIIDAKKSELGQSIGLREQVTIHYLIKPISTVDRKSLISECHLGSNEALESENNGAKVTDFICLEYAHDKFKVSNVIFHFVTLYEEKTLKILRLHFLPLDWD